MYVCSMSKQSKISDFFKMMSKSRESAKALKQIEIVDLSTDDDNNDSQLKVKLDGVIEEPRPKKLKVESDQSNSESCNESVFETEVISNSTMTYFDQIIETRNQPHFECLFDAEEHRLLNDFNALDPKSRTLCFKLFTRIPKWYKINEFLHKIHLVFSTTVEQSSCIQNLFEKHFLNLSDKNNEQCSFDDFFNLMSLKDFKSVCKLYKMPKLDQTKSKLKQALLDTCNKQTTLNFSNKTSDEVLKEKLTKLCGPLMKLNENFRDLLNRIYFLSNLSNNRDMRSIQDIHYFMYKIATKELMLPTFRINCSPLFATRNQFLVFERVTAFYNKIIDEIELKNYSKVLEIATTISEEFEDYLKKQPEISLIEDKAKYFSIQKKYCSILNSACKVLWNQYPKSVHKMLKKLLKMKDDYIYLAGKWYYLMALIEERFFKKPLQALEIMMESLRNEKISLIDQYEIKHRAIYLMSKKSIKIEPNLRDAFLTIFDRFRDDHVDDKELFPVQIIRAVSVHGIQPGQKRKYVNKNDLGEKTYDSVEKVVINHYVAENRDTVVKGIHTEGILLTTLFNLFFWDIIYDDQNVTDVFINSNQYLPLDFYSPSFYEHRKASIDQRLIDIASEWHFQQLLDFLSNSWNSNHLKRSILSSLNRFDVATLHEIVTCIDRTILSQIFKRLLSNFKSFHSGLPDLFIWFINEKKCIFAEVKSKNDKLSIKQKLWLNYLQKVGANVHLCYVYGNNYEFALTFWLIENG